MKQYVKTDKFGCECDYFTEGKVYEVIEAIGHHAVRVYDDDGDCLRILLDSMHTNSQWYFCDANGDKVDECGNTIPTKTITICVEKTIRYNQEVQVTVDEHERLSNLNQDAFVAYKTFKEVLCKKLALKWQSEIDTRLFNAMMSWSVSYEHNLP